MACHAQPLIQSHPACKSFIEDGHICDKQSFVKSKFSQKSVDVMPPVRIVRRIPRKKIPELPLWRNW